MSLTHLKKSWIARRWSRFHYKARLLFWFLTTSALNDATFFAVVARNWSQNMDKMARGQRKLGKPEPSLFGVALVAAWSLNSLLTATNATSLIVHVVCGGLTLDTYGTTTRNGWP